MSQSSLDDDELFGEAAEEMRADVEEHLDAARAELPEADDVWEVEADNTLGVLNALRSALDAEDVESHLRDAKKAFVVGERADAFEDADELDAEISAVEDVLDDIETAREQVGELASTVPALRSALEDAHEGSDGGEDADEEESDEEAEE
ncbi:MULTISPECIES: DUF5790 family protein [Halobacterium]|uniref:DUF5790 family protein n=1 Tax=Halobacterium TaxID=2239 RepID=UPI00073E3202|nr:MULTISPECIES: DUF5790 family protein [Halobacterium]MCG1002081.1 DUF5790 family protein [Halobacterium noricense]